MREIVVVRGVAEIRVGADGAGTITTINNNIHNFVFTGTFVEKINSISIAYVI